MLGFPASVPMHQNGTERGPLIVRYAMSLYAANNTLINITSCLVQRQPYAMELVSVVKADVTNDRAGVVRKKEDSFKLNTRNLQHVVDQAKGMPIAIVSVVGAFGSGKSFLLSCFLKCLEAHEG